MMARKPKIHFLKPGEGRAVLREDGTDWPAEGEEVEETRFVRRRLRDRDLIDATEPDPEPDEEPASEDETSEPDPEAAPAPAPKKRTRRKAKED